MAVLGSCGEPEGPRWIDPAAGFRPRPLEEILRSFGAALAPEERPVVRLHDDGESVWLEQSFRRFHWARGEAPGIWWTTRPRSGGFEHLPEAHTRLVAGETDYARFTGEGTPAVGSFATSADRITLALAPEAEPAEATLFGVRASSGASFGGTWHVRRRECSGAGVPVWAGQREEIVVDLPPRSVLSVTTSCFEPGVGRPLDRAPRLRVRLDGEPLLEVEQDEAWTHHRVPLPAEGRAGARLIFEMEGAGLGLFLAPSIGPAEIGRSGARPWGSGRPDLVLFLADTFRADNLSAWGGAPDLAPELDRAAAHGRRFLQARAAASWTLPSISTLLTGIYPPQHGATDNELSLSRDFTTIAEVLERAGYRTGAVTDAAFFSQAYGLEQGFDWFVEFPASEWDLDRTIDEALAFLERDDGRPVFLVVHSYRVHGPYRQGPDEDPSAWDALYAEGLKQFTSEEQRKPGFALQIYLSLAERFRALYLGAVHDLDRGFGRFHRELERRGDLASGYLVFTSDHGEAFGENGDVWHGRDLWETKLHVPLFILGPGIEPGEDARAASLVDLAPTFASFAGLAPDPGWEGVALVDLAGTQPAARGALGARTTYAFELVKQRKQLAILDGGRKVLAAPDVESLAAGTFERAFDLATDPGEERPVDSSSAWPADLCRGNAEAVRRLLVPRTNPTAATGERADEIKGLGYTGGEKE